MIALLWAANVAASPPPEIRTGTNTNRDTSQPVYGVGGVRPGDLDVRPSEEAVAAARDMARCIASRRPKDVQAALAVGTQEDFRRAMRRLGDSLGNCLAYSGTNVADASDMQLASHTMAGLLAEALFAGAGALNLTPAKYNANAPKLDWMASSPAGLVQLRLAECLAETQPTAVAALVTTKPSSPQEASAFQAIVPSIPACLDKNVTLKATRSSLRIALAFALYRRTIQPTANGVASK
jgi:hypothetical protein